MRMQAALNSWVQAGRLSRKRIKYKLGSQEILRSIFKSFWMRPPVFLLRQFLLQLAFKIKKLSKAHGLWTPIMFIKINCKYEAFTSLSFQVIDQCIKKGRKRKQKERSQIVSWCTRLRKLLASVQPVWKNSPEPRNAILNAWSGSTMTLMAIPFHQSFLSNFIQKSKCYHMSKIALWILQLISQQIINCQNIQGAA